MEDYYAIFGHNIATGHVFNTWFLALPNNHPRTGHKTWRFLISCVCIQFYSGYMVMHTLRTYMQYAIYGRLFMVMTQ